MTGLLVTPPSQLLRPASTTILKTTPRKVLILGGGFAGVAAGKALSSSPKVSTTLLDRSSYHIYHASLYEVATEEVARETVAIPLRQIFDGSRVEVLKDEVLKVDKAKRLVYLKSGDRHEYDFLVVALGAVSNDFGIKGAQEHAFMFREFKETMLLRDNIRTTFHLASERGQERVDVVICGGGFSGVELAAEFRHHLDKLALEYPISKVALTILEAGAQILPGLDSRAVKIAQNKLSELKVEVITADPVAEVKKDGVRLKSGQWVPSDLTVWTAGTKPHDLPARMGLPLDDRGRPVVNEFLAVLGQPDIFVAGDLAGFIDPKTGRGIPPQAYNATEMGKAVGENILRSISRIPLKKFRPGPVSYIIPVGHNFAISYLNGRVDSGWWPSFLRKLIEFRYLAGLFGPLKAWPIFWAEVKVMAD